MSKSKEESENKDHSPGSPLLLCPSSALIVFSLLSWLIDSVELITPQCGERSVALWTCFNVSSKISIASVWDMLHMYSMLRTTDLSRLYRTRLFPIMNPGVGDHSSSCTKPTCTFESTINHFGGV